MSAYLSKDVEDLKRILQQSSNDTTFGVVSAISILGDRLEKHLVSIHKELIKLNGAKLE